MSFELRLGDCMDEKTGLPSLGDGSVTHVISDPPYSARVHEGAAAIKKRRDGVAPTELTYDCLTDADVAAVGFQMSRVSKKWCLVMTSHDLFQGWDDAMGRYTFTPVPIVIEGMTVRLQGDGPSQWTIWLVVNRAIGLIDGTKPGAYVGPRAIDFKSKIKGTKPLWVMEKLIRDYTKPGDLICDPFTGSGTTGVAAIRMGRRFVGWEKDPSHHKIAMKRLLQAREQLDMFPMSKSMQVPDQLTLTEDSDGKEEGETGESDIPDHHSGAEGNTGEVASDGEGEGDQHDCDRADVDREISDCEEEDHAPDPESRQVEEFGADDEVGW